MRPQAIDNPHKMLHFIQYIYININVQYIAFAAKLSLKNEDKMKKNFNDQIIEHLFRTLQAFLMGYGLYHHFNLLRCIRDYYIQMLLRFIIGAANCSN